MKKSNLFYQYYDTLYATKKYQEEVEDLLLLAKKFYYHPIDKILEIGCGTGNHTLELVKKVPQVHAIDIDAEMVQLAQHKTKNYKNVQVQNVKIEEFNLQGFNVAIAMFNVITYIPSITNLISFFKGISKSIKPGGVFIFDCWNGVAALKKPPLNKSSLIKNGERNISCELKSISDLFRQKVTLEYHIHLYKNDTTLVDSDIFSFDQYLWTYSEILYCLNEASFDLIQCTQITPPYNPATDEDWKMMFVCKKNE